MITRILGGQASDKFGRIPILMIASSFYVISLTVLAMANDPETLYIASALFGIGVGFNAPTAFAWVIDLSEEEHRGRAMATAFIALEIGIGIGAILSAWIYSNNPSNFMVTFLMAALVAAMAFIYLLMVQKKYIHQ